MNTKTNENPVVTDADLERVRLELNDRIEKFGRKALVIKGQRDRLLATCRELAFVIDALLVGEHQNPDDVRQILARARITLEGIQ
jgi:hypothetical protein